VLLFCVLSLDILHAASDETRFIDGYPGKHVLLARRSGNTWYAAGINGEQTEKQISLVLPCGTRTATGMQISDGNTNRSFTTSSLTVAPQKPFVVTMKGNGGFVIRISE